MKKSKKNEKKGFGSFLQGCVYCIALWQWLRNVLELLHVHYSASIFLPFLLSFSSVLAFLVCTHGTLCSDAALHLKDQYFAF